MASGGTRPDRSAVQPCGKYFLFFCNFLFVLLGIGAIAAGAWVQTQKENKSVSSFVDVLLDPSIMLLIIGCLLCCISFCGCCGPLRENTCLIRCYYFAVGFFLFVQLLFIIFVFLFKFQPQVLADMNIYPEDVLKDAIKTYRDVRDKQDFIDNIQKTIGCCGVSNDNKGYKDWNDNIYFNCSSNSGGAERCAVPWSCCILKEGEPINLLCGGGALEKEPSELTTQIHTKGCLKGLGDWIESNIFLVGAILLGSLIPQIIAITLARNLTDQVKMQKSKWVYSQR